MADVAASAPDVAALEDRWRSALLAKDKDALRALIHPGFELVSVRPTGAVSVDLDAWLAALERMDIAGVELRVTRHVATQHTIVATIEACWRVRYMGHCIDERVLLTDVWVREGAEWQVIRRHSSLLPASAADADRHGGARR